MDDTRLKTVDREEDPGIIFDNKLSFKEHINSKVKKSRSQRYFLHLDKDMFKQLFTSTIRPLGIRSSNLESSLKETDSYDRKCAA